MPSILNQDGENLINRFDYSKEFDSLFLDRILFFDIETVSVTHKFDDLDERYKICFTAMSKTQHKIKDRIKMGDDLATTYQQTAGLINEYNKIITICYGIFDGDERIIKGITIGKDDINDERDLLAKFSEIISNYSSYKLCGYNIIGFDIPNVAKKMLKYGIKLPNQLHIFGKKPWEIPGLDLSLLYRANTTDYTSLDLLSHFMGCPSPKEGLSGEKVSEFYYTNGDEAMGPIEDYCKRDVDATMSLYLLFKDAGIV